MRDNPETTAQLRALIARGIRIALDDFGTGYSALAYLARLPHHRIKLDKAFVQDLANPATAELIRAIIALARAQGVAVTAEGVERPEHLAQVRRAGFTHAQGYATGAPVPDPLGSSPTRARRRRLTLRASAAPDARGPSRECGSRHAASGTRNARFRCWRPPSSAERSRDHRLAGAARRLASPESGIAIARPCSLSQSPRDPAFVQDPYPFYDRARALGPLFLWEDYGFPCAAGHAEVARCCAIAASAASCRPT